MRWTTNIFTRSVLAAGTAAVILVASGSTSSQASSKPSDLPLCPIVNGVPVVSDLCTTVSTALPDLPLPTVPLPTEPLPTLPPLTTPELPIPDLPLPIPTDALPLPVTTDTAAAAGTTAPPSAADQVAGVVGDVVSVLPPQVIQAAAPLLPALAPVQQAAGGLPLPALPVPIPSVRTIIPPGVLPAAPSLTVPPIKIDSIPGLSDNGVVDVNTPIEICGANVVVGGTPIGIGDCPTPTTAAPGAPATTTVAVATAATTPTAASTCITPETTAAPATTEAPATTVVTNSSVPFQASSSKRTADVTNSSVVDEPATTAAPEATAATTPSTTADGCPSGNGVSPSASQGIKASGTNAAGGNGSGRSGGGNSLPITGLSLIALLVAGAATLSWGFLARMVANRKAARTTA